MFGDRYFTTRERLSGVMHGIASLAADTGGIPDDPLAADEPDEGLDAPLLFVVSGEVNAGKSTFINGLFGHPLCRTNVLPETTRVTRYRHGAPARDLVSGPVSEEKIRPLPFLRNFQIVETPGTDSMTREQRQAAAGFIADADLLFVIFPVTNPWGAATWDFIGKLSAAALQRTIFILQKTDQREAADIPVTLGHLSDLAIKRLGIVPPLFAVSAKMACDAKRNDLTTIAHLEKSGYASLERSISERILTSAARKDLLGKWRQRALSSLRLVEDRIEDRARVLRTRGRFLEEIEREISGLRERFVNRLSDHLAGVAEIFQTEAVWVSKKLHHRLGALRSILRLFFGDRTAQEMEAIFIERLQTAIESVAEIDGTEVVESCRQHWTELGPRVAENMDLELADPAFIGETLASARQLFILRLGSSAHQGIGNLKVRNQLDKLLRRRNTSLKSFTFMTLALLTAGAACGAFQVPWAPAILCGLAGVFLGGGLIAAWQTRGRIVSDFRERLLNTCDAFANTLRADYEEALRIVFQDYSDSLGAVRTYLVTEKSAVEPRLQQWKELFLTLKAIEQEFHP